MRKFHMLFVVFSLLCWTGAASARDMSLLPTVGFSYHFGSKNQSSQTAVYMGYARRNHDVDGASFTHAVTLASWLKQQGNPAQVSIAGIALGLDGSQNEESNKSGMNTATKIAIGAGVAVGALYLLADKAGDSFDDALDEGEVRSGTDDSPDGQNQGPLCVSVGLQC